MRKNKCKFVNQMYEVYNLLINLFIKVAVNYQAIVYNYFVPLFVMLLPLISEFYKK